MNNSIKKLNIILLILLPYVLNAQISRDSICRAIDIDLECASKLESIKLKEYASFVKRDGDSLTLTEGGYEKIKLINNNSDNIDSTILYYFLSFIASKHMFMVYSQSYEGSCVMLIKSDNKKTITLPSLPIFSQDSSLIVAFNLGLGNLNDVNQIEIWRVSETKWLNEFSYSNTSDVGPLSVKWVNNKTIEVELGKYNEQQSEVVFFKTSKIIKSNEKWVWYW
ncbi:MAG: hypothetical protein F9K23_07500 [Bacteroidetes bacterium]|nr:MAG: hypothetical protein F9K23_07500 [Bacteroidota bacterium]